MAKKKAETVAKSAAPKPNLFAKATQAAAVAPKKEKGTVIQLPKELDTAGKLIGESAVLNQAVTAAIEAAAEEKTAKTKGQLAKGRLLSYGDGRFVEMTAKLGVMPPTPVNIVNHNGESVTYVVQDKSQQYPLGPEQVELFNELLGEDGANKVIHKKTEFAFDVATMEEKAANDTKTVFDVVCEIVSNALINDPRLSDEQKGSLIKSVEKTFLQPNTLDRIATLCGADSERIGQFLGAAGSSCVRYIKV